MQTNFEIKSQVQIILIMDYSKLGLSLAQLSPSLCQFVSFKKTVKIVYKGNKDEV